jgi:hypothetical protein
LGRTYITNDEYSAIGENDIVFIETNHLTSGQPVQVKGLGIMVKITNGMVIAETKPIL